MITLRKQRQRYEKYRDSGVEWLGQIPKDWELDRMKYNIINKRRPVDVESTKIFLALENVESWTGKLIESSEEQTLDTANSFRKDDVLFGKLRPYLAKVHHAQFEGGCVGEFLVLDSGEKIEPRYLFYRLLAHDFINVISNSTLGAKMPRAEWSFIGNLPLTVPSKSEQHSIASYLDEKCALIDSIIAKKQRQIELLQEQRAAIINRAVTKGLDENVEMKESGVEWIGEIPKGWEVAPLKWFISVRSGDFLGGESFCDDGQYPVIGGNGKMENTTLCNRTSDTLVIGRVGAKCGNVHLIAGTSWVTDNALMLTRVNGFHLGYLAELLRLRNLNKDANKSAQPLISGNTIKNIKVPTPSINEQKRIMDFINNETSKLEKIYSIIAESISLLSEYKTSLIAHVVTGKVRVSY